jgi:hypothetical protein
MTRGLYRVYLYTVTILLAGFLTAMLANLLRVLFGLTIMRGQSSPPDSTSITQAFLFFVITLVVAGSLGAVHYWLIRRDSAQDPTANESGARTFLLNLAEGIAALITVFAAAISMQSVGLSYAQDITYGVAVSVSALALTIALDLERRRLTPTRGAALVFERLRRNLVPMILLIYTLFAFYSAVHTTELLVAQNVFSYACNPIDGNYYNLPLCVGSEAWSSYLPAIILVGSWVGFLWFGRRDANSMLRQVILLISWAAGGMIVFTIAFQRTVNYLLLLVTPGVAHPSYFESWDVIPLLATGALALAVYGWMLRMRDDPAMSLTLVGMTMRALAAIILAAPFYYGVGTVIYQLFQIAAGAATPTGADWDFAFSLVIGGVAYIPLSLWLGATTRATDYKGPRRGFVLAMLAAGALTTAGGAATLLYALISPLLNVALFDWQGVARAAGAALITGLILGGLYLFIALREQQFIPSVKAPEAPPEPVAPASTLDEALTQFKSGALTQEAAAARIRELASAGAL